MSGSYEVVKYRPQDKARVAELQMDLWSSDRSLNTAYLEWKYENNPYLDEIPIYLAVSRGEIVGMRGFFGSRWEAGRPRRETSVRCGDDLVICTAHRNKGVFTLMMRAAMADLRASGDAFALTLSAGTATTLGSLTMGWKSIGQTLPTQWLSRRTRLLRTVQRPIQRIPLLRRGAAWLPALRPSRVFGHLDANRQAMSSAVGAVTLAREARPQAMADLVEALGTDGRIRHVRDCRYFSWRFANPLNEYRFLYAGGETLTGYLVLRRCRSDRFDPSCVHISDWEAVDGRVRKQLLHAAIEWGNFSQMLTWTATLSEETVRILCEAGFSRPVPSARGTPCVLVRPYALDGTPQDQTLGGRPFLDSSSWDLRMLYSMAG